MRAVAPARRVTCVHPVLSGEQLLRSPTGLATHRVAFFPIVNAGELALYCFVFLYLAAAGPGPWSVDRLLSTRSEEPGQF